MTYQETLEFLYAQLPMYSRIGAPAIKKDLTNTLALCAYLGNPQDKIKTVHIAGTNGKGSVSHTLAAIFQTAGYKTGLYTSPHLKDFRERIRMDGQLCSEQFIVDFVAKTKPCLERIHPSFFELTVAMALEYFAQASVDIAILETGLGGRLDSTNVILPELSVITNIGWDHMDMLGNTLAKIAGEKAGIIKPNVPVVIGEYLPETKPVFVQTATEKNAPILFAQEKYAIAHATWTADELLLTVRENISAKEETYRLDLPGIYQEQNLITVLTALDELKKQGWNLPLTSVKKAIAHVKQLTGLHGRWETIRTAPRVILDVGHNKSCMEQIRRQLEITDYRELYIICGFVKDKDIHSALEILPADAHYSFTQAHIPRAMPYLELQSKAAEWGRQGDAFDNVNDALQSALNRAQKNDLILICGSVFLVAEVE